MEPAAVDGAVAFYSGGVDHRGRRLEEIWSWSDEQLQGVHDYIQRAFPTVADHERHPSLLVERAFSRSPSRGRRIAGPRPGGRVHSEQ